ncbi:hypothetical protein B2K_38955 [Paenibacillus mucilaginosus K02]|uniref:Uncharacterized protein n=1 Tax=Paenibacillus mucilaginosus K02 TaxID=997761 RepID=R9UMZ6_9BACL|nr:hypothetical protein B2K_38955 [Paenibacillus mucilaginosus K02]
MEITLNFKIFNDMFLFISTKRSFAIIAKDLT